MTDLYSIANAVKYSWSSVTGDLNSERALHLQTHLVGNRILDAGCGGGAYVDWLVAQGLDVTGVDSHQQFLEVAQQRGYKGSYVRADVTRLPFPSNSFDTTYCFDVLEHVDDVTAIQELARVSRRRLILAVPKEDETMHGYYLTFFHYQDKTHLRNYTETSLARLVATVQPARAVILPELAVPIRRIAQEMVNPGPARTRIDALYRRGCRLLFERLMGQLTFEEIYTGLVAVVDL